MTVRHCPGCKGYTHGWADADCAGMAMGEFETPELVPPLRFADRLRALIGLPVLLGVAPGSPDPDAPDDLPLWLPGLDRENHLGP